MCDGGHGRVLGAGQGRSELQKLCLGQKSLLGASRRSSDAAGRVLPLVFLWLGRAGCFPKDQLCQGSPHLITEALLTSGSSRKGPGAGSLTTWAQSGMCTQVSFPWLLAEQHRGTTGGIRGPSLRLCFLGDLGSVPSPPRSSLPICTKQPGPGCEIPLALCVPGRTRSCKLMLRSLSPKLRVDFHLLKSLSSSVPTPPLLSLLCDLDGASWTFPGLGSWVLHQEHLSPLL